MLEFANPTVSSSSVKNGFHTWAHELAADGSVGSEIITVVVQIFVSEPSVEAFFVASGQRIAFSTHVSPLS